MSVNPHSWIVDQLLYASSENICLQSKKSKQSCIAQVKPKIIEKWQYGNAELIKFIGFDGNLSTDTGSIIYMETYNLLQCLQLCHSEITTKELEVNSDDTTETFIAKQILLGWNRIYGGKTASIHID